jgi:translation initiation factor IF-2
VKQVWRSAFSVEIVHGEIRVGDGIAVEFPVDFDEQEVTSLRLNDADVKVAAATCEVGIQRHEASPKVKVGMLVYRIKTV